MTPTLYQGLLGDAWHVLPASSGKYTGRTENVCERMDGRGAYCNPGSGLSIRGHADGQRLRHRACKATVEQRRLACDAS